MKIAIATDHAGIDVKPLINNFLINLGHEIQDFGTNSKESCDYADFAFPAAESVARKSNDIGIIFCGSGIGVSIVANKVKGIRAALVCNKETAKLSREHNNANILCFGTRFLNQSEIENIITNFINTDFEGGRHQRRVDKIHNLTKK